MWRLFFALTLACLAPSLAAAGTWYVLPDGSGDAPTIQAAIDSASAGDVVELANGTFSGEGNRDIDFLGKAITVRSESGDPDSCVIDCEGAAGGFIFDSGESAAAVLEAVTVTNGFTAYGGAVYCSYACPRIRACIFDHNQATGQGGAIYINGTDPLVEDCLIINNRASAGGGGYCFNPHSPTLSGCLIEGNIAGNGGGGVACVGNAAPEITDCLIINNSLEYSSEQSVRIPRHPG
ncbi:MAG: right-handed parallel beta-helix repeat-containing protein, partial [Candidatus Eisenbacteria sp.]|nr:right-handed parallel beta-helix repeat-containing protein [Candidatus Eisenbacteria bacterium]